MSSPCLSGGGRTYSFDLEIVKSPSTSRTSHTSSPSSTLSESSNSPLAISTRKPRTPRKRPNQTYNEAAALLSTAYPGIFSTKHLANPRKFTKSQDSLLLDESSELLFPFRAFDRSGFLIHQPPNREKPGSTTESKFASFSPSEKSCQSSGEVDFQGNPVEICDGYEEDFDAESILDEEIEEGIDSILGNLSVSKETMDRSQVNSWCGSPMGFHFGGKFQLGVGIGMRRGVTAFRQVDEGNWCNFPIVDMLQISPRLGNNTTTTTNYNKDDTKNESWNPKSNSKLKVKLKSNSREKKKKVEKPISGLKDLALAEESSAVKENPSIPPPANSGLLLKLNYDEVLNAWSGRGTPFSDEVAGSEGTDVSARLAQIDLFSESGGVREASVLRYKEKRHTRLFSKKIRYQVRKVNADQRPRMKGRFVRRLNSSSSSKDEKNNKKCFKL